MRGFLNNRFYITIFGLFLIISCVFIVTDKLVTAEEAVTTSESVEENVEAVPEDTQTEPSEEASDSDTPEDETLTTSESVEENVEIVPEDTQTESSVETSDSETPEENPEASTSIQIEESEPDSILSSIENFIDSIIPDDKSEEEEPAPIVEEEKPAPEEYEATRTYNKKIFVNKEAKHTCEVEVFKVDISDRDSTTNTITLTKEADISYEIEVGSIPDGFDIKFVDNDKYEKAIGLEENSVDIEISKKSSAPEGSYTIPFIYTQKGVFDSSVICQINIVNL